MRARLLGVLRVQARSLYVDPGWANAIAAAEAAKIPLPPGGLEEARRLGSALWTTASELSELEALVAEESGLREAAAEERRRLEQRLETIHGELERLLVPPGEEDASSSVILEVLPGAGGEEASLWAGELLGMYLAFARLRGWGVDVLQESGRHAEVALSGDSAYRLLKFEGGVHRVQRVPKTEKGGRMHTSTASVVVLPQPARIDVVLGKADLKVEVMTASGPGGQHVNKTESCVRVTHLPSGTAVSSQQSRSQNRNREICMARLAAILYERKLQAQQSKVGANKKLQIGSRDRSEKIRTYNFSDNRVTDHRIKTSFNRLAQIMEGGEDFITIVDALQKFSSQERLNSLFNTI